jgi:hypothetical protein
MLLDLRFAADSNSTLSATQSGVAEKSPCITQESLKIATIPQVLSSNRTGEGVPSNTAGKFSVAFLQWEGSPQKYP